MNAAGLLHLLQFASPALPIGGYSYSQGLEAALEDGLVTDAASARSWMLHYLHEVMAQWDGPLFWRLLQAFAARDGAAVALWSDCFLASRDSAELRAETVQMGYSLTRLIATGRGRRGRARQRGIPAGRLCLRRRRPRHPA